MTTVATSFATMELRRLGAFPHAKQTWCTPFRRFAVSFVMVSSRRNLQRLYKIIPASCSMSFPKDRYKPYKLYIALWTSWPHNHEKTPRRERFRVGSVNNMSVKGDELHTQSPSEMFITNQSLCVCVIGFTRTLTKRPSTWAESLKPPSGE